MFSPTRPLMEVDRMPMDSVGNPLTNPHEIYPSLLIYHLHQFVYIQEQEEEANIHHPYTWNVCVCVRERGERDYTNVWHEEKGNVGMKLRRGNHLGLQKRRKGGESNEERRLSCSFFSALNLEKHMIIPFTTSLPMQINVPCLPTPTHRPNPSFSRFKIQ